MRESHCIILFSSTYCFSLYKIRNQNCLTIDIFTMKFFNTILSTTLFTYVALAAPVESDPVNIPSEAILGYMDFTEDQDVGVVAYTNSTFSGLIFFNSSIIETKDLTKRDAEAGWMRLRLGQPLKKRDADADADAGWMRLSPGKPMKKREADADAEAGWMRLRIGQPL